MVKNKPTNNGLTLVTLQTSAEDHDKLTANDIKNINKFIMNKFNPETPVHAVFYFDYGIRFARWKNGALEFYQTDLDFQYLQIARIFNENQELKIWKNNSEFFYRLRVDQPGTEPEAIEAEQILWGTMAENLGDKWTKLFEERGTELVVPIDIRIPKNQPVPSPRACIKTRNYIEYLDNGQASYVDCRFVSLGIKKQN